MSTQGTEADWYRHVLYGLAGETFEVQEALDKFEAAVEQRHARSLAEKLRAEVESRPAGDIMRISVRGAANFIDPDKDNA
jgi:hypothetical protein